MVFVIMCEARHQNTYVCHCKLEQRGHPRPLQGTSNSTLTFGGLSCWSSNLQSYSAQQYKSLSMINWKTNRENHYLNLGIHIPQRGENLAPTLHDNLRNSCKTIAFQQETLKVRSLTTIGTLLSSMFWGLLSTVFEHARGNKGVIVTRWWFVGTPANVTHCKLTLL